MWLPGPLPTRRPGRAGSRRARFPGPQSRRHTTFAVTSADTPGAAVPGGLGPPGRPVVTARSDAATGRDVLPEMHADPGTFWSIYRSPLAYRNAGDIYLRLPCPTIYCWDPHSTPRTTRRFLAQHLPLQRQLSGLGE